MKFPEFDMNRMRWDAWNEFYNIPINGFTQFKTGVMLYGRGAPDPDERKLFPSLDVHVISTADAELPALMDTNGDKIPKAWLHYKGIQYLLWDRTHNVVVGLGEMPKYRQNLIPSNYRGRCRVFWANKDALPLGGNIEAWKPYVPSNEEKEFLKELQNKAKVMCTLKDYRPYHASTSLKVSPSALRELLAMSDDALMTKLNDEWTATTLATIAFKSDIMDRERYIHKYLQPVGAPKLDLRT